MFHDDLSLYINKEYRSSYYLEKCWSLIEEKIIFFIGTVSKPILSICFEADSIYFTVISNKNIVFQESIPKYFSHSLNLCEDFVISIVIDPFMKKNQNYNCTYSFVKDSDDEGVVELISDFFIKVENYEEIKNKILLKLCLEVQYAINKNIFIYNISNILNKSDIDSFYEFVNFNAKIKNINFQRSLKELLKNNIVPNDIYIKLLKLSKEIEAHYVQSEY